MSSFSLSFRKLAAFSGPAAPLLVPTSGLGRWARRVAVAPLVLSGLLTATYTGLSIYLATRLVAEDPRLPITRTPAALGLAYRDVCFPSCDDHLTLCGWFIPGVLPDGRLTTARAVLLVHGHAANRADPDVGILDLSAALARRGFAVLAFDLRGHGQSAEARFSLGQCEQRDVLGAVDFLRSGVLPYPELGRPSAIGGWGVSLGAVALMLAAAEELAIKAIVSDAAFANALPILEKRIPQAGVPAFLVPGVLLAARALYGVNFSNIRPVGVVARLAPRPLCFIHGAADPSTPPADMAELAVAASAAPEARVESWLVPGATHAQSFKVAGQEYISRMLHFFEAALGPLQASAR